MSYMSLSSSEISPPIMIVIQTMVNLLRAASTYCLRAAAPFVMAVLLFQPLLAQDSEAETDLLTNDTVLKLSEAIKVALANNPQVKRSLLDIRGADKQVAQAWSQVLPDITGSMSYTRNLEVPVFFFPEDPTDENSPLRAIPVGEENNWLASLTVEQTIFDGQAFVGISSSKLFKAAQAEGLRATSQQIVTQTRLAYYNVLIAEEQLQLQKSVVERLKENLEENKARQNAGLIDQYDVLQVQVQLSNEQPQLTQARYAVQQAYRELKVVLGIPLNVNFSVLGDLDEYNVTAQKASNQINQNLKQVNRITPFQYTEQAVLELATEMRGDIRVLEKQNELKGQEIKAIKSRFLPTISGSYNLGWRAQEPGSPSFFGSEMQRVRTQSLMLTLSVPIFQGFERTANLSIAKIEKKDLEIQKRAAIRSARNEIQSAREALKQAIETAPARQEAVELAREGYERARLRLENGLGSQLDVTNAELQLREAEANYAQMVYNYLSAKAQYDLAIGMVPFVDKSAPSLND